MIDHRAYPGDAWPEPYQDVADLVGPCLFDAQSMRTGLAMASDVAAGIAHPDHKRRAFRRLFRDAHYFNTVVAGAAFRVAGDLCAYWPAYSATKTGRLAERGLQQASQPAKGWAWSSVPGVYVHDMRSAHPSVVASMMERDGLAATGLRSYVDDPGVRPAMATDVGVTIDELKPVMNAIVYAQRLPSPAQVLNPRARGAIAQAVRRWSGCPEGGWEQRARDFQDRLAHSLGPLDNEIRPFLDVIRARYLGRDAPGLVLVGEAPAVVNLCGRPYFPGDPARAGRDQLPTLMAHLCQGAEAAFVHEVARRGPAHGYRLLLHLHDGGAFLGRVPHVAVEEAQNALGLHGLTFSLK